MTVATMIVMMIKNDGKMMIMKMPMTIMETTSMI